MNIEPANDIVSQRSSLKKKLHMIKYTKTLQAIS